MPLVRVGLVVLAVVAATLTVPAALLPAGAARAADNAAFDPGFIISDETFYDEDAMSQSDVQRFLDAKNASCSSYTSGSTKYLCIRNLVVSSNSRAGNTECAAISGKSAESAASVIYRVAQACGINPQVILVTLQKEQGLITAAPKTSGAFRIAMGYACPDTAACDSKYYGFFNQIYSASWQFQRYKNTASSWNYRAGRTNTIRYHPSSSCGSSSVYIRNQATAGLYIYTPYQPNAAALAAGSGIGDSCSSYGNRNFWRYFTDWFGNPSNLLKNAGFERSTSGWGSGVKTVGISLKKSSDSALYGSYYASTSTERSGSSLRQTVSRSSKAGELYTATIWVKSRTVGVPFEGKLRLSAVGGATEYLTVPFTADDTWQQVSVTLPITSSHTSLRLDVYLFSTGVSLALDGTSLSRGTAEPFRLPYAVSSAGFEGSATGWSVTSGISKSGVRTTSTGEPASGSGFYVASASQSGASVRQSIPTAVVRGRSYTASVMLRTSAAEPFEGALVLRGIGGATDSARTDFEAGPDWTRVQVTYTATQSGLSSLRFEIRLNTVGGYLWMDDVVVTPNLAADGGFESGGLGNWVPGSGEVTLEALAGADPHPEILDGRSAMEVVRVSDGVASMRLPIPRKLIAGESYLVGIWVRNPTGDPVNGSIRLWGTGSVNEHGSTSFTASGGEWQYVEATYTVTAEAQTSLRVELYLNTVGVPLQVDGLLVR